MAEVVLFHHVRGLTAGVVALGDAWRSLGHTVHTPDVFEGHTFDSIESGSAYAEEVGFGTLLARAGAAVAGLATDVVYAGISMGVVHAEFLALSRPGARGVVMLESAIAPGSFTEYGATSAWPTGLAFQVHGMDGDPFFADEGDLEVCARDGRQPGQRRAVPLPPATLTCSVTRACRSTTLSPPACSSSASAASSACWGATESPVSPASRAGEDAKPG